MCFWALGARGVSAVLGWAADVLSLAVERIKLSARSGSTVLDGQPVQPVQPVEILSL